MSYKYGLDERDLEEVAHELLGTRKPLGMAMRQARVPQADADVVIEQLRDEHQIVKCSACHTWTDKSDEDPAGPLCEDCQ